ncbi:hypothetical protein GYMLUDRAFT_237625 [Collybiopsis luxurians FD-317 M1]|nr:hypothetical protein GYMLUDRAFT_237625 [Collybiopsis luxurians FD-317 M1]
MAAIVHRASSALHEHTSTPVIPQRRPREPSIEIIDVDQLDESEYMPRAGPSGSNNPSQRRRPVPSPAEVLVIDSDDDDDYNWLASDPSATTSQANSRAPSLHPGYPELSRSPPMRRHPPPFPSESGPVTANPMALDYERFLTANVRRSASATRSRASAGPSSSTSSRTRTAASGTRAGGGIITSAQANAAQRRAERDRLAQLRASGALGSRFRARRTPVADDMHFVGVLRAFDPFDYLDFDINVNGLVRYGPNFIHPTQQKQEEPDYLPEYTHPETAPPGFSFDLEPSAQSSEQISAVATQPKPSPIVSSRENPIILDDEGEIVERETESSVSTSGALAPSMSVSLVCSNCLDPLLLGEGTSAYALKLAASGVSAEQVDAERKARRLWGLRCGHLIDGRCLDALGYPPGAIEEAKTVDVKGKGKTKAVESDDSESEVEVPLADTYSNPIRSRLRSATQATNASTDPATSQPLSSSIARRYLPAPIAHLFGSGSSSLPKPKPKPRQRRKAKQKVQDTYSWMCPVAKCGKVHTSVKIAGVWGPEKEKGEGAVALYI